jgi:hypothetical protein
MQEFVDIYKSVISTTQRDTLNSFITQANNSGLNINAQDPMDLLKKVGEKLFKIPTNVTDPNEYNKTIMAIITDLTSLYAELDNISTAVEATNSLNNAEIAKLTKDLDTVERTIRNKVLVNRSALNYTNILTETFSTDTCDNTKIPTDKNKLWVDPVSMSLRRQLIGDISRTISVADRKMCKISIENMLGISTETRHSITELVDGNYNSFWREVILADAPIAANIENINWLPANYKGGAVVRLRVDFDYLTPINELSFKPLSPYPMKLLAIDWTGNLVTDKTSGGMIPINGNFKDDTTGWTITTTTATAQVATGSGMDGSQCLEVITGSDTANCTFTRDIIFLSGGIQTDYTTDMPRLLSLSLLLKQTTPETTVKVLLKGETATSGVLTLFSQIISQPYKYNKEWAQVNKFINIVDNITYKKLMLEFQVFGDTTTTYIDNIQLSTDYSEQLLLDTEISGDKIVNLSQSRGKNIACKTLWLTLAQPHYTLKQYNIPRSYLAEQDLWNMVLVSEDNVLTDSSASGTTIQSDLRYNLPEDNDLNIIVNRLGGKIKDLIVKLYHIANPTEELVNLTKYEYILGGWELDLRYREFIKSGYWVSQSFNLPGEIRELTLLPTMNTGDSNETDIRFYVSLSEDESIALNNLKKLEAPNYNLKLKAVGEPGPDSYISIAPKQTKDIINGTDRYHKAKLSLFPYISREKIATIKNTLDSYDSLKLFTYDPNTTNVLYTVNSSSNSGVWNNASTYVFGNRVAYPTDGTYYTCIRGHNSASTPASTYVPSAANSDYWQLCETIIKTIPGYKPIEVKLKINNKLIFPDILGRAENQLSKLVSREVLDIETDGSVITDTSTTDKTVATRDNTISRKIIEEHKLSSTTYITKYPIEWDDVSKRGNRVALYWHKVGDIVGTAMDHTNDILIKPSNYDVVGVASTKSDSTASYYNKTRIIMKSAGFSQIPAGITDTDIEDTYIVIAYYRTRVSAAGYLAGEEFVLDTTQVEGLSPLLSQSYPVTRNMTDYVNGTTPTLKLFNDDKSNPEKYYPVYEYYINEFGEIVFANDLFYLGDTPAEITVDYQTLGVNPRIVIEMDSNLRDQVITGSPVIYDYTVLLNIRK